jgi:transcriptional regulator with XRE-family HTH domain
VGSRVTRLDQALEDTRRIIGMVGREIRSGRHSSGLSLRAAGRAVDISHAQFVRIERGEIDGLTISQASRACAAIGLKLVVRVYANSDAVLDTPQLALLERFRSRLGAGATWSREVPLPLPGDRRAWDAVVEFGGSRFAIEAEARLRDLQALERRVALKQRDGAVDVVVLLVNDTASNRAVLKIHERDLRAAFPLDGRAILAAIDGSRAPAASGILLL